MAYATLVLTVILIGYKSDSSASSQSSDTNDKSQRTLLGISCNDWSPSRVLAEQGILWLENWKLSHLANMAVSRFFRGNYTHELMYVWTYFHQSVDFQHVPACALSGKQ